MSIAKLEPLSRKEMKKAIGKPLRETKRKLKQGLGIAPIFYYVLKVHQFNDKDTKIIEKGLATCHNPQDCQVLICKQPGWSYREISLVNDFECGALLYKGLAVAVYFKRQVNKIEPEPTDPIPSGALENLNDVWARLDLFTKSPRQLVSSVHDDLLYLKNRNSQLEQELQATNTMLLSAHKKLQFLEKPNAGSTSSKKVAKHKPSNKKGK